MTEETNGPRRVLASGRLQLRQHKQQTWYVDRGVDQGVTLDDLLDHDFWLHAPVSRMSPYDEIIVFPEDGRWRAHLHVIETDETGLTLDVISFVEFPRVEAMRDAAGIPYRIVSDGPGRGYKVLRNDKISFGGFATRHAAEEFLRNSAPSIAKSA